MSRTYKDRPYKIKYPKWYVDDRFEVTTYITELGKVRKLSLPKAGVDRKIKRGTDEASHYLQSTPSWWNRLFHTKPLRRKSKLWERSLFCRKPWDLTEEDPVKICNKPHKYYW